MRLLVTWNALRWGMPFGAKATRAVGKQKMLNYVMRVGTTAAAIENNLQELIAARLETEIEMERIYDRQTGGQADS